MVHIRFLAASGGAKGGAAIFLINVFLLLQSGCPYIFGAGRQLPPFNHCYWETVAHVVAAVGFLPHYPNGPLPYVQRGK